MTARGISEQPLLRIDAVTKRFGGFVALDNVSVDIRPGERFGLIGPNGSGKTTLINCISGALRAEVGTVVFAGEDITRLPAHMRTRRGIARSFQIPRPFKSMTPKTSWWRLTSRASQTASSRPRNGATA